MEQYDQKGEGGKKGPVISQDLHGGQSAYAGTYTREGNRLTRLPDGLILKWLQRPETPTRPTLARDYLVDGSTGQYVSSLYDQGNGTWEFDDHGHRYRVRPEDGGTWAIEALYRVGSGSRTRRGNRHV